METNRASDSQPAVEDMDVDMEMEFEHNLANFDVPLRSSTHADLRAELQFLKDDPLIAETTEQEEFFDNLLSGEQMEQAGESLLDDAEDDLLI